MLYLQEVLETVPSPGRYALIAFTLLGITVLIIFYFMKKSIKRANKHFGDSSD
ncbi:MAG: hypothetical protein WAO29_04970 [Candidatus Nanopelagicales bacterium]